MSGDVRPDRHALLELDALLAQIESLVAEGDRARFDSEVWRMTTIRPAQLREQIRDL